jgi:hypothetical protein
MDTVFPGCLAEPVFLNALVYSITHTLSAGEVTVEGLRLEAKVIEHLNTKLTDTDQMLNPAVIGAIMILKGVAVGRALL